MKLSVISDQISESFEEAFSTAKEYGYDSVEIHNAFGKTIEELEDHEVKELKRMLQAYQLSVSNIASTIFFVCPLYDDDQVTGFNESFHVIYGDTETHLRYLKRACEIADELECRTVRLFPFRFPENRKPPFGDTEDADRITEVFLKASDLAQPYGVTLAVENCPYSHMPKGEMTLGLIRRINRPNVRLLFDPANSYRAVKENVPERYRSWDQLTEAKELAPYIAHVHIKNYHYDEAVQPKPFIHVSSGSGDIDYVPLLRTLFENGYEGYCSLEPEVGYEETLESMRWLKTLQY